MSAVTVSFVGVLCRACRFLLPVLAEHLDEQEGEVLPHLFLADVVRWSERALSEGRTEELRRLFIELESEFVGPDEEVQEAISASFLEHLPRPGTLGSELREFAGPRCAERLRVIG